MDLDPLLIFHGDAEVADGLVDLAVNVRSAPLPPWLDMPIRTAISDLSRYPDQSEARAALAARHRRDPDEVLLTAGAAQAFTLIAQAYEYAHRSGPGGGRAVVVHPQFTEPEAALRAAGVPVTRVLSRAETGFALDDAAVPDDADLVMIGNPTNPTSVLHPATTVARLARPGRLLVVDEAFADTIPGEPESLAGRTDLPGLVVIRSLTKTWGLAGLRVGYLLAAPDVVAGLARHQPLWPVATPALAAATACAGAVAVAAERDIATALAAARDHLLTRLAEIDGVAVAAPPRSSFVLIRVAGGDRVRAALREHGYAVRRGDTFPGLDADHLRVAVRAPAVSDAFADVLRKVVT